MKKLFLVVSLLLSIIWTASAQTPTPTINGTPPPFVFTGSGVVQTGQTFTFAGAGSNGFPITLGSTSVAASSTTTSISGLTLVAPALGTPTALVLTNATGLPAASVLSGSLVSGMAATTQSQNDNSTKLATTAYTDLAVSNAVAGVNPAVAVLAASTANVVGTYTQVGGGVGDTFTVTATGAFTLDGIAINTIGQRVLFKDQSTASQNGVYFASVPGSLGISPVFTRALDYDTPSDVNNTGSIPVQSGTVNTTTSWLLTSQVTSIGSSGSALTYAKFSIAPSTLVTASSPGAGVAHFAGGTQAVTSSAVALTDMATQSADTVVMNASGSTAAPTAVALPTCTTGAVLYNTSTHAWSCVSISSGAITNITGSVTATGCSVSSGACAVSGSTTTAVTFSVIPGTYNALKLVFYGNATSGTPNVNVTYNSDTTSGHYAIAGISQAASGTPGGNTNYSAANCPIGYLTSGAQSNAITSAEIWGYANTSFWKTTLANQQAIAQSGTAFTATGSFNATGSCGWASTSAITSITATISANDFVSGTTFILYGIN